MDFSSYQSTFSWRYGSLEMRSVFSEKHKYELWRKIWVALARAEHKAGLVSSEELGDLEKNQKNIDIERILEIEKETKHDVVAGVREFAQKAKIGGGKIHLGATSMDVTDNADAIRQHEALALIQKKLQSTLLIFGQQVEKYADTACLGYTHLQAAEPTTIGYRLAFYAQDFLNDFLFLQFIKSQLKGKGLKGAVGTSASYERLLSGNKVNAAKLEQMVMEELGMEAVLISSQVYPRKSDFLLMSLLSSIASSAAKFAGDLRILQSSMFGEWSEPFSEKQVGSSAMPFKRNPINSEKICSLARYVSHLPGIMLENASLSHLERTLDDSANRRIVMAESFLAVDEILNTLSKIISGLVISEERIKINLEQFAPFAATEVILLEAVKKGADRQKMHETLREISMQSWEEVQKGKSNPMKIMLVQSQEINKYFDSQELGKLLNVTNHVGNAPERARELVRNIREIL